MKTYNRSKASAVFYGIGLFVIYALVATLIFGAIFIDSDTDLWYVLFIIYALDIALAVFSAKIMLRQRVEIDGENKQIIYCPAIGKKRVFPIDEYVISSDIVQNYYSGIPAGASRFLAVTGSDGKRRRFSCHGLSKSAFEEMMMEIRRLYIDDGQEYVYEEHIENTLDEIGQFIENDGKQSVKTAQAISFSLDKEKLPELHKKRLNKGLILVAAIGIPAMIILGFLSLVWVPVGAVTLIIAFIGVYFWQKSTAKTELVSTPKNITVTDDYIELDGFKFFYNEVEFISLTPPSYNNTEASGNLRHLRIIDGKGKYIYSLGSLIPSKTGIYFEDYSRLCGALEMNMLKYPNIFRYELG